MCQSSRTYVGAGESIKKIGKSLYVDSLSGEADTAIDIIKDIVQKIPNINYSAINIVYIKTKGGVVLVDGYIYPNKLYGAFRITSSSEGIKSIRLFNGDISFCLKQSKVFSVTDLLKPVHKMCLL